MNISLDKTMDGSESVPLVSWAASLFSCCYWKLKLTSGSLYAPCSGTTIVSWRDLEALNHCQMQQRSSTWRWGGICSEELSDGISYLGSWEETGRLGHIQERYLEAGKISRNIWLRSICSDITWKFVFRMQSVDSPASLQLVRRSWAARVPRQDVWGPRQ